MLAACVQGLQGGHMHEPVRLQQLRRCWRRVPSCTTVSRAAAAASPWCSCVASPAVPRHTPALPPCRRYVVGQYPRFLRNHWKFLKTGEQRVLPGGAFGGGTRAAQGGTLCCAACCGRPCVDVLRRPSLPRFAAQLATRAPTLRLAPATPCYPTPLSNPVIQPHYSTPTVVNKLFEFMHETHPGVQVLLLLLLLQTVSLLLTRRCHPCGCCPRGCPCCVHHAGACMTESDAWAGCRGARPHWCPLQLPLSCPVTPPHTRAGHGVRDLPQDRVQVQAQVCDHAGTRRGAEASTGRFG